MKKLSEQLLEMSKETAARENLVASLREEDREVFEAEVARTRKSVQASQAAFAAKLDSVKGSVSSHWHDVQKSFNNQVATARSKAAERKAALDLTTAQAGADIDENNAQIATEFAQWAVAEANAAIAQANQSRAHAKSVENGKPSSTATS